MTRAVLVGLVLSALSSAAWAHDTRPGAVVLREVAPDRFAVRITQPRDPSSGPRVPLAPAVSPCRFEADGLVCAAEIDRIKLLTLGMPVLVHVAWLDGATFEDMVEPPANEVRVTRAPTLGDAAGWFRLGVDHIVFGPDHLLFVLGLLLVARRPARVAWAVTGFTVAHSITLGATVLGWVAPPMPAVELVIAASVLLLAVEAAAPDGGPPTWTARAPWAVAGAFGLIHGFGFAGALAELPLPDGALWRPLLLFNLGVEAGQLAVVVVALGAAWAAALAGANRARGRVTAAYLIGLPAGAWTVLRTADFLGV